MAPARGAALLKSFIAPIWEGELENLFSLSGQVQKRGLLPEPLTSVPVGGLTAKECIVERWDIVLRQSVTLLRLIDS